MEQLTVTRVIGLAILISGLAASQLVFAQSTSVETTDADTVLSGALSPEAEAFRTDLELGVSDLSEARADAILGFYVERGNTPFWKDKITELQRLVELAPEHGLPAGRYDAQALSEVDGVALEIAATSVFLQLAGDLSAGVLKPVRIDPEMNIKTTRASDVEILARLASASLADVLRGMEPQAAEYRLMIAEKTRLEAMVEENPWGATVSSGPTLHEGESSPRVAELRARLGRMGYSAPVEQPEIDGIAIPGLTAAAFDAGLVAQVKRFQRDYGLVDDGAVGRRTLRAINASAEDRLEQVHVNLERLRWMNRDLGERHIIANIPDFTVTLYSKNDVVWHSRSVVGKSDETRTPEFSDEMTHMVVNPTWHIPDSIATRVYLPKLRDDPGVLARNGMSLFTRSGQKINPKLVNFKQYGEKNFPFRVKQNPSAENALGRVKFMFPNQFAIYLHDTPSRNLFNKDARAFSNGCVRLEQPLELAYALLEQQYDDPEDAFAGWLRAKSEKYVNLADPVDVHIVYRTAWFDSDGNVQYRDDIYCRDAKVMDALRSLGVSVAGTAQG